MIRAAASSLVLALLLVSRPAPAAVERLEISERVPLAAGTAFGPAGAYEKIRGKAWIALDPDKAANARIVDLKLAPRDAHGRVLFSTDFLLLRPVDPAKRNGTLLYDVNNRGNIAILGQVQGKIPPLNDPTTREDMGNAFLLKHGFTLLWSAWTWDVEPPSRRMLLGFSPGAAGSKCHCALGIVRRGPCGRSRIVSSAEGSSGVAIE